MTDIADNPNSLILRHASLHRLAKKYSKEIEMLTVFTKEGEIVCSHETPSASAEQPNYSVSGHQRDPPARPVCFHFPPVPEDIY